MYMYVYLKINLTRNFKDKDGHNVPLRMDLSLSNLRSEKQTVIT